jgi:autotransporter-associated beta strand protein
VVTNSGNALKTLTVNGGGFGGRITGNLNLTVAGGLELNNSSTYTGNTLVTGTLKLSAVPGGGTDFLPRATILTVTQPGQILLREVSQTVAGLKGDGTITDTGSGGGGRLPDTLTIANRDANANYTFSGTINGALTLIKDGPGAQVLSGANTYDRGTVVRAGTLIAASNQALGTRGVTVQKGATLGLSGGITIGQDLKISGPGAGNAGAINNLEGKNTIKGNITLADDSTIQTKAGVLTIAGKIDKNGKTLTLDGKEATPKFSTDAIKVTGEIVGKADVIKTGPGTVEFSGANTYNGPTRVNQGVLLVNNTSGSGTGNGLTTVAATGTLAGNGSITGPVTVEAGGALHPGDIGFGTFHIAGDVHLMPGSFFQVDLGGTQVSQLSQIEASGIVNGVVDLSGDEQGHDGSILDITLTASAVRGQVYDLIHNVDVPVVGRFEGLPDLATLSVGGELFQINYNGGTNGKDVVLEALSVPEPASLILLGTGMLLALISTARSGLRPTLERRPIREFAQGRNGSSRTRGMPTDAWA